MLSVQSLYKSHGSRPVLSDFNLTLNPSEILFLSGPSGCGKTTALRAIAHLDTFESGKITLSGLSSSDLGPAAWRRDVMYVSQSRLSLPCTPVSLLRRSLAFASRRDQIPDPEAVVQHFIDLCEQTGLKRESVETLKWTELSGGQAQRAAVVMCIALKPKVLLLDEPTSSCDHQSALQLEAVIVKAGIPALWVTHDEAQPARIGGRIVNMHGVEAVV